MRSVVRPLVRPLVRRLRATASPDVTFCEQCGQVCTADCRSAAHLDRVRTEALRLTLAR